MSTPLEMWISPLTNRIYVGRSKNGVATFKQDVTAQCINGAIAHLIAKNDFEIIVNLDEGRYRVMIKPVAQPVEQTRALTDDDARLGAFVRKLVEQLSDSPKSFLTNVQRAIADLRAQQCARVPDDARPQEKSNG